jgi:hypothetical protein
MKALERVRRIHRHLGNWAEPTQLDPGGSPYPSSKSLAEIGKEDKKDKEEKKKKDKKSKDEPGVHDDLILEVLTILEGVDLVPFLEDDELLDDLLVAFPVLGQFSKEVDAQLQAWDQINFFELGVPRETILALLGQVPLRGQYRVTEDTIFVENPTDAAAIQNMIYMNAKSKLALVTEPEEGTGQFVSVSEDPDYDEAEEEPEEGIEDHNAEDNDDANYEEEGWFDLDEDYAKAVGEKIGIDWDEVGFDPKQFLMGIEVEFEHGSADPETNVTDDNIIETAKIAWAHLKELDDYYYKLKEMEDDADAHVGDEKPDERGEGSVGKFNEGFPSKKAVAYMTLCPNCKTIQRVDYWKDTPCPNCTKPIPGYFHTHPEERANPREAIPEDIEIPEPAPVLARNAFRLQSQDRARINEELRQAGFDGNGRFEKPGSALTAVAELLSAYNISLSDFDHYKLAAETSGDFHIELLYDPTGGVAEDPQRIEAVENSSLRFSWHCFDETGQCEVIAYLG